jgi:hypothetical protein
MHRARIVKVFPKTETRPIEKDCRRKLLILLCFMFSSLAGWAAL